MENIAVSRNHQRSGIGQFLMQKIMDLAKEYPDTPIVLYVRSENAVLHSIRISDHQHGENGAPEKSGKVVTYEMTHHRK